MKKFGFFGGSFDPIHFGHLNFLVQMAELHNLERIFVSPTGLSPHKVDSRPKASIEHRYEMVSLATDDIPCVELIDWEMKEDGPTYTIDTVRKLKNKLTSEEKNFVLHLILTDEQLSSFSYWKEASELAMLCPILAGTRAKESEILHLAEAIEKYNAKVEKIPLMEISSTIIRERLHKNLTAVILFPIKCCNI